MQCVRLKYQQKTAMSYKNNPILTIQNVLGLNNPQKLQCHIKTNQSILHMCKYTLSKKVSSETSLSQFVHYVIVVFTVNMLDIFLETRHSSEGIIQMIKSTFKDDSMSDEQIKVWYRCFNLSWKTIESNPYSGRRAISRTAKNLECK